jgi:hypothetical protein
VYALPDVGHSQVGGYGKAVWPLSEQAFNEIEMEAHLQENMVEPVPAPAVKSVWDPLAAPFAISSFTIVINLDHGFTKSKDKQWRSANNSDVRRIICFHQEGRIEKTGTRRNWFRSINVFKRFTIRR